MKTAMRRIPFPCAGVRAERGFVLLAALAVLLMLTLLSVGMFHSFGLEERITGNSREKQRAFYAAQTALQGAEEWLSAGNAGGPNACSMTSASANVQICTPATTLPQEVLATTGWNCTFGTSYVPPALVENGNPVQQMMPETDCNGDVLPTAPGVTFYMYPQIAITYLGPDPASQSGANLYQVTALGYGGNQNSIAVLQSVYSVGNGVQNFGMNNGS